MEQHISPNKGIDSRLGDSDIAYKVRNRQVLTTVIHQDRLPSFLGAASATGFKVEKIADEGEKFPRLSKKYGNRREKTKDGEEYYGKLQLQIKVSSATVEGKGYIAVSIEKPEGSKDHNPFWKELETLDQNKA